MSRLYKDDDHERESLEETMQALGVDIIKKEPPVARVLSGWINSSTRSVNVMGMNVGMNHVSIAPKWAKKIKGKDEKLLLQFRVVEYNGQPALLFRKARLHHEPAAHRRRLENDHIQAIKRSV